MASGDALRADVYAGAAEPRRLLSKQGGRVWGRFTCGPFPSLTHAQGRSSFLTFQQAGARGLEQCPQEEDYTRVVASLVASKFPLCRAPENAWGCRLQFRLLRLASDMAAGQHSCRPLPLFPFHRLSTLAQGFQGGSLSAPALLVFFCWCH